MTEHEVKIWLQRAYRAYKKAESLETLLRTSRMHAEGLCVSGEYNRTAKTDTRLNGTENAFMKLADIEQQYDDQKLKFVKAFCEIKKAIGLLDDSELKVVLIHRYLLFHTIERTAELMNYSPKTVKRKQKKAIQKLTLFDLV